MQYDDIFNAHAEILDSIVLANEKVQIRIKQRTRKKSVTTIENIPEEFDLKKITKELRKSLHCNGSVQTNSDGSFIQLFGDQRYEVKKFLQANSIAKSENIIIHGY